MDDLGMIGLFRQSFDVFTIALLVGSLVAVAVIARTVLEIRERVILPSRTTVELEDAIRAGDPDRVLADRDPDAFVPAVVAGAWAQDGRGARREAAELAAGEQSARWFRRIEPLNLIGNIGPLIGLAGTVWGMILAFTSLGAAGGQAGPEALSLGISKALFHTLLGLCLAIPCLVMFGIYRGIVDRICTRAMLESARLVEMLPECDRSGEGREPDRSEKAA